MDDIRMNKWFIWMNFVDEIFKMNFLDDILWMNFMDEIPTIKYLQLKICG